MGNKLVSRARIGPAIRPAQAKRPRTPIMATKTLDLYVICFRLIVSRKIAMANKIGIMMKTAVKTALKSAAAVVKARII